MMSPKTRTVSLLGEGLGPGVRRLVCRTLSQAGMSVESRPAEGTDLYIAPFEARDWLDFREGKIPVLILTRRVGEEEEALARGAWGAITVPVDGHRLLEWVNRLLVVDDRARLVDNLLGVRRWIRRLDEEADPDRAIEFLYWAPKVVELSALERKLPGASGRRLRFAHGLARRVSRRVRVDLFDDLVPLSIDLEFRWSSVGEERDEPESFADSTYYRQLLDAKLRLEEILAWAPVARGLGRRAKAADWIRTPQLDQLAVRSNREESLPRLQPKEIPRLVRDLRHFHRIVKGNPRG